MEKRKEFWRTRTTGRRHVWEAIKQACETDSATAGLLLQEAEIFLEGENMTGLIDIYGNSYYIPVYLLNPPKKYHVDESAKVVKAVTETSE